ncbi:MAG TPA: hypothetical protein VF841_15300 [Anaeromyxobacter sp.]
MTPGTPLSNLRARITFNGAVLAAAAVLLAALLVRAAARGEAGTGGAARGARGPIALAVSEAPPEPSIWIDVHEPAKIWKAARSNAWIARAMKEPLGAGAGADWAGFLSTRGSELAGAFEGAVADLVAGKLLADPFRVVFFTGEGATGAPAVIAPAPSSAARSAFDVLEGAARNGSYEAPHCPGAKAGGDGARIAVSRWLIAGQALFAAQRGGRIVLARNPAAVVQALCAPPPDVPAAQGVDLSLSFSRDALGREARLGAALLGLGPSPRIAFAVAGDRLEPRGLLGEVSDPDRLAAAPPPERLLRLVPADAGVVLVATLRLPEKLDRESLVQHLERRYRGAYATRPVALVWTPRGDAKLATEVAIAWPERDARFLEEAFSGPNRMERRRACGHEVLASTGELAAAMQEACDARAPSILNGPPAVAAGLGQDTSIAVGVNLGAVLSRLVADAHASEAGGRPAPEIDAARRLLEELPFIGVRGVAKDGALVPGGFRS